MNVALLFQKIDIEKNTIFAMKPWRAAHDYVGIHLDGYGALKESHRRYTHA
jgi:hypothetical protein